VKWNGTCSVASVSKDHEVQFYTRDGDEHKAWTPTEEARRYFEGFPDSVFCFELLHNKGPAIKDTLYLFDVVRWLGEDLVGTKFRSRMTILNGVAPISPRIIIAKVYAHGIQGLFKSMVDEDGYAIDPLREGVVLKDPEAELQPCYREGLNSGWQVKCRARSKNMSF
jgi:ATP-dependent DNA ligase